MGHNQRTWAYVVTVFLVGGCEDPPAPPGVIDTVAGGMGAGLKAPAPLPESPSAVTLATPVPVQSGGYRATTNLMFAGSLGEGIASKAPIKDGDAPNYRDTVVSVVDAKGGQHCLTVRFTHTGPRTWAWQFLSNEVGAVITPNAVRPPVAISFGADGTLLEQHPESPPGPYEAGAIDLAWRLGSSDVRTSTISIQLGRENETDWKSGVVLAQTSSESFVFVANTDGKVGDGVTELNCDKAP